jgi:hypothetical protein
VLEEADVGAPSYPRAQPPPAGVGQGFLALRAFCCLRRSCRAGPVSLALYDVSALDFEIDAGDGQQFDVVPWNLHVLLLGDEFGQKHVLS